MSKSIYDSFYPSWQEEVSISKPKEERKEIKYLGTLRPQKGQTVFELNLKTKKVKPATFKEVTVELSGKVRKKLIVEDDCMYEVALNETNAKRKFLKRIKSI